MECCSASLFRILRTRFHTSFVGTSLEQRLLHSFMRLSSRHGALLSTAAGLKPPTCQMQPQNGEIYTTLQHKVSSELEVKRSKFIAVAAPIYDEEGARAFLSELGEQYRFNDDGEPGGTAGRPIHSAIVSSGLDRVMAVVIRYFGGIKLGTGGLVRAYGGVTSECLKDAPTCVVKSKVTMILGVPFDLLGSIYPLLRSHQVGNLKHEYDVAGDGINQIKFAVDFDKVDTLEQLIKNSCHA